MAVPPSVEPRTPGMSPNSMREFIRRSAIPLAMVGLLKQQGVGYDEFVLSL